MLSAIVFVVSAVLVPLCDAGNNTITDEVFFDINIENKEGADIKGRFIVGLFGDVAPASAMNFVFLAKGYKKPRTGEKLHYKNSFIHRVVPDFVIQMGDITVGDGTGGRSIFSYRFDDEPFILSHKSSGWLAWANHGPDSNGSQFYITLAKARWLDSKNLVFAKVIKGMDIVQKMGAVESQPHTAIPTVAIKITNSGVLDLAQAYDVPESFLSSDVDLVDSQKLPVAKSAPKGANDAKQAAAPKKAA